MLTVNQCSAVKPSQWAEVKGFFKYRFHIHAKIQVTSCDIVKASSVVAENHRTAVGTAVMLQTRQHTIQRHGQHEA